jgi:hypothetical protein
MILQQNNTHKAVRNGNQIDIIIKGFTIPAGEFGQEYSSPDEYLYSIPAENEDDLFAIFERLDEDNRINVAEFKAAMGL